MVSRRQVLALGGGMVATLAGCTSESTQEVTVEDERDDPLAGPPSEATTDFDVRALRAPVEEPFVRVDPDDEEFDDARRHRRRRHFVLDDETAARFEFEVEHEEASAVRSFVEDTDYDAESVVVHQRPIDACYVRRVEYVIAEPDRYRVQFCRELKEATTPCEADETEMKAVFIRLPQAYEEPPSRRGSGERSRCHSDYWEAGGDE